MNILDKWIKWNEKQIESHDFCMAFEQEFRKEIRKRIKQKQELKKKINRQMVRS